MSDRRYGMQAWKRLRKAVLDRDGHQCLIQGPRCLGYATTVHHQIPSSEAPELFWEPTNLVSSCTRCNYSDGARLAAQNKRTRAAELRALVFQQQQEIERLRDRLRKYEDLYGRPLRRASPAIY